MHIAFIISTRDHAGLNIQRNLFDIASFAKLPFLFENKPVHEHANNLHTIRMYMTDDWCVEAENIDKRIAWGGCELIVFPITHRSAEGVPSLTVHAPGNWHEAKLGGKPGHLPPTHALFMKFALQTLRKLTKGKGEKSREETEETNDEEMDKERDEEMAKKITHTITMEATHHGPYVEKPIFFIEIGSGEEQWKDKKLGMIIARTLMHIFSHPIPPSIFQGRIALAIGGPHYMPNFNKIIFDTDNFSIDNSEGMIVRSDDMRNIAIGHACPKHQLEHLDKERLLQAMRASNASLALLDWKGLGQHKQRITALLEECGIKAEKI